MYMKICIALAIIGAGLMVFGLAKEGKCWMCPTVECITGDICGPSCGCWRGPDDEFGICVEFDELMARSK